MSIAKTSLDFINHFFPLVEDNIDVLTKNTIEDKLKKFHIKLIQSDNFYDSYKRKIKNESVVIKDKFYLSERFKLIKSGNYIPSIIHKEIKKVNFNEIYYFQIKNIDFQIHFVSEKKYSTEYLNKKIERIIKMIHLLLLFHRDEMLKAINILLFLTDKKKELPNKKNMIVNENNVNTAVTFSCSENGEIFLYRDEESFKVLIHELLHSMCYDFSSLNTTLNLKNEVLKMFNVNSKFYLGEAYAEFWANIINTTIMSYELLKNKTDFEDFTHNFKILNLFERMFSIFQCIKFLDYMGLKYTDIISKEKKVKNKALSIYREDTNVFAYHILKMVWLFNTESFINWFDKNNQNLIYSEKTHNYIGKILKKTKNHYNEDLLIQLIEHIEKFHINSKKYKHDNESIKKLITNARMCLFDN